MLRKRIVSVLTFNEGTLFRTKLFSPDYRYTHNFVDSWLIDEIVVLDVTRGSRGQDPKFLDVISRFASECFVPLSIGGGVRSIEDVRRFMAIGADKVVVNTAAFDNPGLIQEIAKLYGAQCVVVSIDAKRKEGDEYEVMVDCGRRATGRDPFDWAKQAEDIGAGEIMVTSVERDGSLSGYDLDLTRRMVDAVSVPVLALGGAGNWKHFGEAFASGVSAACTQNIYHFTDNSISSAKKFLASQGVPVRL